jgi:hypothetical protein
MRYIKLFLEDNKAVLSSYAIKDRELINLCKRIQYNLRKFFNDTSILVFGYYNKYLDESDITIMIQPYLEKSHPMEYQVFIEEYNKINMGSFITFKLDKESAEKLLLSIKKNFKQRLIEIEAEKYNL